MFWKIRVNSGKAITINSRTAEHTLHEDGVNVMLDQRN